MRKHDPKTFDKLIKIIDEYEGEKPNPFQAYRKDHGYIKKYSKKQNGPIIKDIKYLYKRLNQGLEISKTENTSDNKKVVLLSLNPYRVDVYYNEEKSSYKNLGIKYNDLIFKNRRYVIDKNKYKNIKKELRIDDKYEFLFSLHKNDIVGIANKEIGRASCREREESRRVENTV